MNQDQMLREQLIKMMRGGQAFTPLSDVLNGITVTEASQSVENLPYTIWQLLEHLRIAQFDILEFSRNPNYESPEWPADYWPHENAPADQTALDNSILGILSDLEEMIQLVQDPANDLYQPFAHGQGQNLLREALLIAEHNAYHLGQILVLQRLLGSWE